MGIRVLVGESYVAEVKYSLSCLGGGVGCSSAILFLDSFFLALILRRERSISGLYGSGSKHKERLPSIYQQGTKRKEWNHHNSHQTTIKRREKREIRRKKNNKKNKKKEREGG